MLHRSPRDHHQPPAPRAGLVARRSGRVLPATALLLSLALVGVVSACSGDDGNPLASPEGTVFSLPPVDDVTPIPAVTIPEGFVLADARGVRLLPFESSPKAATPPLPVEGGSATIHGTVTGPDGPVGGASVLLERLVGDQRGTLTVTTGSDGRYAANKIHGGKYRVRAWQAPTLATTESEVTFVADLDGSADIDLGLEKFEGKLLQVGLDVTTVNVGDKPRVRALLTNRVVSDEGIVVGQAIPAAKVRLTAKGSFEVADAEATTNEQGLATWTVTCTKEGTGTFTADADEVSGSFTTPNCEPKITTTTTTPALEVPDFPVGDEFDVPHKGILPAGKYETFLDDCATTYEVYLDGKWQADRRTSKDSIMNLPGPARDFKAASGTDGCSYRRNS